MTPVPLERAAADFSRARLTIVRQESYDVPYYFRHLASLLVWLRVIPVPMRHLSPREGNAAALKADALSLTAFEVGLFGWMLLQRFVFFHAHPLHPDEARYWFMMQLGMVLGFVTSYPMNWWLIKRGIKEAM